MYDVIVIGAGTAGLTAAKEVRKYTDNYVLVHDGPKGTTCARVGCMPSKVMIHLAELFHERTQFEANGIRGTENLSLDQRAAMSRVRSLRDHFVGFVLEGMESVNVIDGKAEFVDNNTIKVGNETLQAKAFVLATGSTPRITDDYKDIKDHVITSDTIFEMEEFPESIAAVGLGVIGIEMAQSLSRMGVKVTAINRSARLAAIGDPEVLRVATKIFEEEMDVHLSCKPKFKNLGDKVEITDEHDRQIIVDKVLVSSGRLPNVFGIGLEKTKAKMQENGVPEFDPLTLQIKGTDIYIAGDTTGENAVLHEAADEGRIAGFNAVHDKKEKLDRRELLRVIFSKPNVVVVGKSYPHLDLDKVEIGEVSFESQGRAKIDGKNKGLLRVYGDKKTGELIGSEMIAPDGEHMGHLLALAIQNKMTVKQLLHLPFYHPVLEEGLRTALRDLASKIK